MNPAEIVRTVRNFVRRHGERFDDLDEVHEAIANPVGYRRGEGDKREFWIKPVVWAEELCGDEMDPQDLGNSKSSPRSEASRRASMRSETQYCLGASQLRLRVTTVTA